MSTLLSPERFSDSTPSPQVNLDPVPSRGFSATESIAYGFKAMYSGKRFFSWFTFSLMAMVIHLPVFILMIPFLSATAVDAANVAALDAGTEASLNATAITNVPDIPIWAIGLYFLALIWSIYVQASIIRGIIEGVRSGRPTMRDLAFPIGRPIYRIFGFTLLEVVLSAAALAPLFIFMFLAADGQSLVFLIVGQFYVLAASFLISLFLMFGRQVIIDSGKGVLESAAYSFKLVKANLLQSIVLIILTMIIAVAAAMALVIPVFFVLAPLTIAPIHAYRRAGHGEIFDLDAPSQP